MKTISPKQLKMYLREHPSSLLIDLRPRQAYLAGHVRGARHILYEELEETIASCSRQQELIFYCERGGSAMAAARQLEQQGWQTVAIIGGYADICRLTEVATGDKI